MCVYSSVIIMGISFKKLHLEIAINTSQSRNQGSGLEMEHLESGARRDPSRPICGPKQHGDTRSQAFPNGGETLLSYLMLS